MGHGDDDLLDFLLGGLVDGKVQQRDQTFPPFQGERLGSEIFPAEKFLEDDRIREPGEDPDLFLAAKVETILCSLHALLQPVPHGQLVNVHELDADGPAIGVAEPLEDFPQRYRAIAESVAGKPAIHLRLIESIKFRFELGDARTRHLQWIDGSDHMAPDAVVTDKLVHPILHRGNLGLTSAKASVAAHCRWIEDAGWMKRWAKTRPSVISVRFRQLIEIGPPFGWDGKWVLKIIEIESFDKSEIYGIRQTLRFAHDRVQIATKMLLVI